MTAVPQHVKDTVDGIMGNEEPVLVKMKQLVQVCLENGLAYKVTLTPAEMLTHPMNRAGQMLSAQDVWQKGMKIWTVGVRKELLCDSMAFELSLDNGARAQQVSANQKLVDGSGGLLSALNGKERFLSVSSSHTTAWLKAVASGCQCPQELGSVTLKKGDPNSEALMDLLENGWTWVVFNAAVELQWSHLPGFIQMAMNSTNGNNKQLSEIECAAQLAQCVLQGQSLSTALEQLKACDPQCKRSLEAIAIYVSKFGGGEDQMGLVMWATMMTAPRQVDGVAKILTKSDTERLKNPTVKPKVLEAETILSDSWQLLNASSASENKKIATFGRLAVRACLHVLQKEKMGREVDGHKDLKTIGQLLVDKLNLSQAAQNEDPKKEVALQVCDTLNMSQAEMAFLQNGHMKVAEKYINSKDHGNKIFVLLEAKADHMLFERKPLFTTAETVQVPFAKLKEWKLCKAPVPAMCDHLVAEAHMCHKSDMVALELQKSHVQNTLLQACMDNVVSSADVAFTSHPAQVWSLKKFAKGKLKLYPCGIVSALKGVVVPEKIYIKAFGKMWLVSPMKALRNFTPEPNEIGLLAPFWWVKYATAEQQVSMVFSEVTLEGCKIPVLQNNAPLNPHGCLVLENVKASKKKKTA
eukprot:Skav224158  [mRNA]  locus=scaffold2007:112782:115211:+ [translate_table: standard]